MARPVMGNRVISIVQLAPQSGKTTVATNLAGELSRFRRVALIDCHPLSRKAAEWGARRQAELASKALIVQTASIPSALLERVFRLRDAVDYVVLDGPADTQMTAAMAALAHLCLVPVPAVADADQHCADMFALLREARQLRKFRVRGITVRQDERSRQAPPPPRLLKMMDASLCERRTYAEALEGGRTAAEYGDLIARDELHKLAIEVTGLLPRSNAHPGDGDAFPATSGGMPLGPRSLLRL